MASGERRKRLNTESTEIGTQRAQRGDEGRKEGRKERNNALKKMQERGICHRDPPAGRAGTETQSEEKKERGGEEIHHRAERTEQSENGLRSAELGRAEEERGRRRDP